MSYLSERQFNNHKTKNGYLTRRKIENALIDWLFSLSDEKLVKIYDKYILREDKQDEL